MKVEFSSEYWHKELIAILGCQRFLSAQFCRYFVSGVIATVVHLVILSFLVELTNCPPTVSSAIGFIGACLGNYMLQHYWVFSVKGSHRVFFLRYITVTAITFFLNIGLFWLLFQVVGLWYLVAQLVAIALIFILNFLINRSYTFKNRLES